MNASFSPVTQDPLSAIADLLEAGDAARAESQAATLRAAQPDSAEAARLHGIALLHLGRSAEALTALEYAVERAPASVAAQCNLGSARIAAGRLDEAIEGLRAVLRQNPGHAAVLMTLGNALMSAGRFLEAQRSFATATYGAPRHPSILINLAAAELKLGHYAEAEACIRDAISVDARNLAAYLLYGDVLMGQGRHRDAATVYAHAQKLAPEAAAPAYQHGLALDALGELEEAATAYGEAVARDPQLYPALSQWVFAKRRLCDWEDLEPLAARVLKGVREGAEGITPFAFLAEAAGPDEQLRCARSFAAGVGAETEIRRRYLSRPTHPTENEPLRVGFVSNGFGEHPTGLLTVALFEALRSRPIEVHLFATGGDEGPIRRRLRAAAHHWHDLSGATADTLAQTISDAGIDRLVDLRGWGEGGTGEAFALRPAPVQVNWLAYPGTSGAAWIDYVIADAVVLPEDARASFSERVAYLPRCFQPSDTTRVVAAPPDRVACGLPESGVVLACFNNSYKLNPTSFARMLAVLREVPDAVLWLLSGPGDADARLRDAARNGGIDPDRLIFQPRLPHAEYLARFGHADLFLDTTPYNAHTTASDAIWAGCPVLTLPGDTFASRVAASLNTHLGMPALNAVSEADFGRKAVAIASDPAARAQLRAELVRKRESSGLFDMDAFADDFVRVLTDLTPLAEATADTPKGDLRIMTAQADFVPLDLCVLTVSDTRSPDQDTSGDYLVLSLGQAGHRLHERRICRDDRYLIRAIVATWIAEDRVNGVIVTGGTGFTGRDSTPEAIRPLLDKEMPGFGETFRALSYHDIGTSTMQSRAFAGLSNNTFVFCLPGSTSACRLAWDKLLREQLDARTRPCNLPGLIPRLRER